MLYRRGWVANRVARYSASIVHDREGAAAARVDGRSDYGKNAGTNSISREYKFNA